MVALMAQWARRRRRRLGSVSVTAAFDGTSLTFGFGDGLSPLIDDVDTAVSMLRNGERVRVLNSRKFCAQLRQKLGATDDGQREP